MPYIKQEERERLDPSIERLSSTIASKITKSTSEPLELGQIYSSTFLEISKALHDLVLNKTQLDSAVAATTTASPSPPSSFDSPVLELASSIFESTRIRESRTSWAGNLNYALTRIIQIVPRKLVAENKLETEFRYWLYAVTAGSLARTAFLVETDPSFDDEPVRIAIAGVLIDVKDEYKRRVNSPYEDQQILANGDCYDVVFSKGSASIKS